MATLPPSDIERMFVLNIFLDQNPDSPLYKNDSIVKKYKTIINERQSEIYAWKSDGYGDPRYSSQTAVTLVDSGFDLICPINKVINERGLCNKINHGIKCSMTYNNKFCGYYLYPRSSMGSKTPLRLSNSVGIIDPGYRGNIMSVIDNMDQKFYEINKGDRLTQICGPNLLYPIWPQLVERELDLIPTKRGGDGFGSTGK